MTTSTSTVVQSTSSTSTTNNKTQTQQYYNMNVVIQKLVSLNINCIAIDFDQTILDIHTGGHYNGPVEELVVHVRPIFIHLLRSILLYNQNNNNNNNNNQNHQIHIAIVTFSRQPQLIRQLLERVLLLSNNNNNNNNTNDSNTCDIDSNNIITIAQIQKIVIRANDPSWKYEGDGCRDGKQAHIASAVEEILHTHINNTTDSTTTTTTENELIITKKTTLLIDDDKRNIRIALQDGTRAIWYNPTPTTTTNNHHPTLSNQQQQQPKWRRRSNPASMNPNEKDIYNQNLIASQDLLYQQLVNLV